MVARVWREVEQGVTTNGYEVSFWVDENSIKLSVTESIDKISQKIKGAVNRA